MSLDNFISYLQQILSMINPKDKYSVALGKSALSTTIALAISSEKVDPLTHRTMMRAEDQFEFLAQSAKDFAGKPGDFDGNEKRRRRLLMSITPSC